MLSRAGLRSVPVPGRETRIVERGCIQKFGGRVRRATPARRPPVGLQGRRHDPSQPQGQIRLLDRHLDPLGVAHPDHCPDTQPGTHHPRRTAHPSRRPHREPGYNCQLPLAAENQASLRRLEQGLFKQTEASYIEFQAADGRTLHRAGSGPGWALDVATVRDPRVHPSGTRSEWLTARDGSRFLDVRTDVSVEAAQEDDILATSARSPMWPWHRAGGLFHGAGASVHHHVRKLGGCSGSPSRSPAASSPQLSSTS